MATTDEPPGSAAIVPAVAPAEQSGVSAQRARWAEAPCGEIDSQGAASSGRVRRHSLCAETASSPGMSDRARGRSSPQYRRASRTSSSQFAIARHNTMYSVNARASTNAASAYILCIRLSASWAASTALRLACNV
eukprot:jgi/Chrpa1/13969/Chrysochromulina_OHIO_Genome00007052-RA